MRGSKKMPTLAGLSNSSVAWQNDCQNLDKRIALLNYVQEHHKEILKKMPACMNWLLILPHIADPKEPEIKFFKTNTQALDYLLEQSDNAIESYVLYPKDAAKAMFAL
jgi:hypothetical protein